jgi:hypothetical protein
MGIVGIGIPAFLHSCMMRKPATSRKASLLRIRAFKDFTPIMATKIGMRALSFNLISSRRGRRSFFFSKPRAETDVSQHFKMLLHLPNAFIGMIYRQ